MQTDKVINKEWLSPAEVREYAGIGRTKLWEILSAGEIAAAKVGRSVKVNRLALEKYLADHAYAAEK